MPRTFQRAGPEILVNTQTAKQQFAPSITNLSNGGFVVSWQDQSGTLGDHSGGSVKAQVFDATGGKVGAEFLVNTQTDGQQGLPTITGLVGGGFVVSWQDYSGTLGDTSDTSVKAQVFNAAGGKVGSEFLVNTETANYQFEPTITGLAGGGFVVTWDNYTGALGDAGDPGIPSIRAQLFNSAGARVGSEFQVNTQPTGGQSAPTIASLSTGGFVASWYDPRGALGDTSAGAIRAQVFDAAGGKVGGEFLVNTQTAGDQVLPTITGLDGGGFVVSWYDFSGTLGDTSGAGIKAQVFNAAGGKVGTEFLVNTQTAGAQLAPSITSLVGGGFVVTWSDPSGTLGEEAGGYGIKAQVFDATGGRVGSEFLINSATANDQFDPAVTRLASGGFAVSWVDRSGLRGDASGGGVKAQVFVLGDAGTDGPDSYGGTPGPDTYAGLGDTDNVFGANSGDLLSGDDGDDFLRGQAGNDTLQGGAGNDFLAGADGNDVLDGGSGLDRTSFFDAPGGVHIDLAITGPQDTGFGIDTFISIEHTSGTIQSDTLSGDGQANWLWGSSGGNDILSGRGGDDLLVVSPGNHTLDGGTGIDTVGTTVGPDFTGPLKLSLALQGAAQVTGQGNMLLTSIENLSGTVYGDTLTGDGGANVLAGDLGDDSLSGGDGADVLRGDGSIGIIGNSGSGTIGVTPDISILAGSDPGNNTLDGGAGADTLFGGRGGDVLTGGSGADLFVFNAAFGHDMVTDFRSGEDRISFQGAGLSSFADLRAHAAQVGANVLITLGSGDSLQLNGVALTSLTSADFLFG